MRILGFEGRFVPMFSPVAILDRFAVIASYIALCCSFREDSLMLLRLPLPSLLR